MSAATPGLAERLFAQLMALQRQARAAASSDALAYAIVNDSQPLFGFRHAALLIGGRVRALTGVSVVEPNAPFVAFAERVCRECETGEPSMAPQVVERERLGEASRADWQALAAPHVCRVPLAGRGEAPFGVLLIGRDTPWQPPELALLGELGDCYAHAWRALEPRRPWRLRWPLRRRLALAGALSLALLVPVRQSVLAPAEVIPRDGQVVAAPLDGVVAEFLVKPNQPVDKGQVLLRFDATSIKAQADVAERALAVAEAELKANAQRAFVDAESSARTDLFAARAAQKRAELEYARELLERTEVRAERGGIAVFADDQRWIGKPVQTGERLMQIADPAEAQLRIDLAVADALDFDTGTEVALFLDSDPLGRHAARLQQLAYEAQALPGGQLAYRLDARFEDAPPRIGLRGTAKLYGERGPLVAYLLRRPVAALRQAIGL